MMEIQVHLIDDLRIAEAVSDTLIITDTQSGVDLLGNLYYQEVDHIILHERNIAPAFFDLKTGMAGEILQKFSNYRMRLAIVGDFTKFTNTSLQDFIRESNKSGHINFVSSQYEALQRLSGK